MAGDATSTLTLKARDEASKVVAGFVKNLAKLEKSGHTVSDGLEAAGKGVESFMTAAMTSLGVPRELASGISKLTAKTTALGGVIEWARKKAKFFEDGLKKLKQAFAKLKALPGKVLAGIKKGFEKAVAAAKKLWASIKRGLKTLALLGVAIVGLGAILGKIAAKVEAFVSAAAEAEGVNAAFLRLAGEGAPRMLAAMRAGSAGMIESVDLMKAYNSALLLINKTVADQLPQALKYLTKISLATGESMAYLLDSLVRGVGRLSPRIIDNLKIQVTLAEGIAFSTEMFGKQADAMSVGEKQAGMMALVMSKLEAKTSGLADVTGSLVQLMAKYKVMTAENAKLLANFFIPVAKSFYKLLNQLATATYKNLSEGGKWYNVLRKVSATMSVVIDLIGDLVGKLISAGSATRGLVDGWMIGMDKLGEVGASAIEKFADKMFEAAWKALEWGANIVNNLAIGITRGAATVLLRAINFISNILSYWMSPGSAPRFLPNLLAWGSAAFTEYLRGFTEADYGVLTAIQAPLRGALQSLANLGEIADEDIGPIFARLSESMAAALEHFRETGEVSASVLAELAAIGGGYGAELEELFKRQLAVAAATQDVADAEKRLADARSQEESSGKKLSKQAREYNKLLREGASQEALRAKLAEMRASHEELEDARDAAELAEDDLEAARERSKEANRLARLQAELLRQLLEMARIREEERRRDEDDGGGIDGIIPGGPLADMIPSLDQAFEDLKNRIRARFQELWADLQADWAASGVGSLLNRLKEQWETSELKVWFEEFIFDIKEAGLRTALNNLWGKIAPAIQGWLDDKDSWWMDIWRAFTQEGIDDGSGRVDFGAALDALWVKVKEGLNTLSYKFGLYLARLVTGRLTDTKDEGDTLGSSFAQGISDGFLTALGELSPKWLTNLVRAYRDAYQAVKDYLGIHSASTLFWGIGDQMIDGLISAIRNKGAALLGALRDIVRAAIDALWRQLGLGSPSRLFMDIGENMVAGLTQGIESSAAEPRDAVLAAVGLASGVLNIHGASAEHLEIHNHFGRDSVRSNQDILDIANAISRSMRLAGVKGAM